MSVRPIFGVIIGITLLTTFGATIPIIKQQESDATGKFILQTPQTHLPKYVPFRLLLILSAASLITVGPMSAIDQRILARRFFLCFRTC
jgi:hypothetical protein